MSEADDARAVTALVADLGVRGMWQPQTEALIDVRVVDTDAPSHAHTPYSVCCVGNCGNREEEKVCRSS